MTRRERSAGSFSRETLVEVRVYLAVEKKPNGAGKCRSESEPGSQRRVSRERS
jgi:hypothetical protein